MPKTLAQGFCKSLDAILRVRRIKSTKGVREDGNGLLDGRACSRQLSQTVRAFAGTRWHYPLRRALLTIRLLAHVDCFRIADDANGTDNIPVPGLHRRNLEERPTREHLLRQRAEHLFGLVRYLVDAVRVTVIVAGKVRSPAIMSHLLNRMDQIEQEG